MNLSKPQYLPEAPPINAITLGISASMYEFEWGDINIKSITNKLQILRFLKSECQLNLESSPLFIAFLPQPKWKLLESKEILFFLIWGMESVSALAVSETVYKIEGSTEMRNNCTLENYSCETLFFKVWICF